MHFALIAPALLICAAFHSWVSDRCFWSETWDQKFIWLETSFDSLFVGQGEQKSGTWWYVKYAQRMLQIDILLCVSPSLQVLQTLGTETYRPSSASQCVAGIACAEIPVNQWPELIPQLVANVTNPNSTEHMKESTLEAIGYICQDIVSICLLLLTYILWIFYLLLEWYWESIRWKYQPAVVLMGILTLDLYSQITSYALK